MSMSRTDVLIEAIQSKVTDEQVTSWVAELGDILDEMDRQIAEWQSYSVNVLGAIKAKDKLIAEQEKALAICEGEYRKADKLLAECYEFILNNVGVQDPYIDYEGKYAILKKLKGE